MGKKKLVRSRTWYVFVDAQGVRDWGYDRGDIERYLEGSGLNGCVMNARTVYGWFVLLEFDHPVSLWGSERLRLFRYQFQAHTSIFCKWHACDLASMLAYLKEFNYRECYSSFGKFMLPDGYWDDAE